MVGSADGAQPDDDSKRYQPRDPKTLTVQPRPFTRKDYVDFLRPSAKVMESGPDRQRYGPRHALPALAVYAFEGDRKLGEGIKKTLRHYSDFMDAEIKETGGVVSLEGAYLCAMHFRELRKRNQMTPEDEKFARDLLLKLRRYQGAWRPNDGLWRGVQHRSQSQGINHALAAHYYPDEADAGDWKAYADEAWGDWWNYRDVGINDVNYFFGCFQRILCAAVLLDREETFTDPDCRRLSLIHI